MDNVIHKMDDSTNKKLGSIFTAGLGNKLTTRRFDAIWPTQKLGLWRSELSEPRGGFSTTFAGWWCNNHLEKYEFVNGKDYPIYIMAKECKC